MNPTVALQRSIATLAIVHHANQFLITDGYDNRLGISAIMGAPGSQTGLTRVLRLHEQYKVPFNLHISGTLLESIAWHCPWFFSELERLAKLGLVELLGGSYGQNMMRFFPPEHNLRQLMEELLLYENLLGWNPETVTTFWTTERLWETEALAPVLKDSNLQNQGYRNVVVDDRLLYPNTGSPSPRLLYDYDRTWDPGSFRICRIKGGHGLCALPISYDLRQNIPPRTSKNLERVKEQLHWLLDINAHYDNGLIAIYADDMEKVAGVGWDPNGPGQFETVLKWVSENPWVQTVKLGDWASSHPPVEEKMIDTGAYVELVNEFEAGETYDKWFYDPRWAPYNNYHTRSENKVRELESKGADPSLIELARKTLLATAWQTAWHTPRSGAHGEWDSDRGPSAWVRAIASHSRIAPIIAEAAFWMVHKNGLAQSTVLDIDQDGQGELVIKNDHLFAVFSPPNGGRLVYLFGISSPPGRLFVGNPVDDWNLLEALHEYMDVPPNHPGGFSDVGHEHDNHSAEIQVVEGERTRVRLKNVQKDSSAFGLEKMLELEKGGRSIRVDYSLPDALTVVSTEIGLSPDYLHLLRAGKRDLRELSQTADTRGWTNRDAAAWVKLDGGASFSDSPRQTSFGHGNLLRVTGGASFTMWVGAGSMSQGMSP